MALADLSQLDQFKTGGFVPGYPADQRSFFSPVDDIPGVELALVRSVTRSFYLAMYGFDSEEFADAETELLHNEHIPVLLVLDSSQAGGVHEKKILAREHYPASSIVIGRSEHGAIMHLKKFVIDGVDDVGGSTNQSVSGETLQDNELVVRRNPLIAADSTARILAIGNNMRQKAGVS